MSPPQPEAKPHIFKVRWGWCSIEEHGGIRSSWLMPTFRDLCAVLAPALRDTQAPTEDA